MQKVCCPSGDENCDKHVGVGVGRDELVEEVVVVDLTEVVDLLVDVVFVDVNVLVVLLVVVDLLLVDVVFVDDVVVLVVVEVTVLVLPPPTNKGFNLPPKCPLESDHPLLQSATPRRRGSEVSPL